MATMNDVVKDELKELWTSIKNALVRQIESDEVNASWIAQGIKFLQMSGFTVEGEYDKGQMDALLKDLPSFDNPAKEDWQ
jgi:translation elongation factor EF-1beta